MEKKTYISPESRIVNSQPFQVLTKSPGGGAYSSGKGIGYGGTDVDGTIEPEARERGEHLDGYYWDE